MTSISSSGSRKGANPRARIRLSTRGDDAGSCRSANLAIRQAFEHGFLRNASVMAVGTAVEHAAEVLRDLPGLALGLHVALNCEWEHPRWGPVLPPKQVPALVDDQGHLTRTPMVLHERKAPLEQMLAEVRAQYERLTALKLSVQYLDQHMGVGWVSGLGPALEDFARRRGLLYAEGLYPDLPLSGERHPDAAEDLVARLRAAARGTYLVIGHPCFDDEETRAFQWAGHPPGAMARDRDGQRRMFLEDSVGEAFRQAQAEPCRYVDSHPGGHHTCGR